MDAPKFHRTRGGILRFQESGEGRAAAFRVRGSVTPHICLPAEAVRQNAVKDVRRLGGDVTHERTILAFHKIQFGKYHGHSFKWLLENALGYSAYLVTDLDKEQPSQSPLSINKYRFKEYLESFPEGREALEMKRRERQSRLPASQPKESVSPAPASRRDSLRKPEATPRYCEDLPPFPDDVVTDAELLRVADDVIRGVEKQEAATEPVSTAVPAAEVAAEVHGPSTSTSTSSPSVKQDYPLTDGWKQSLPEVDHAWVSRSFFKVGKTGKGEFDFSKVTKLWYNPPQHNPSLRLRAFRFYTHPMLLWFPRKLWSMRLVCPEESCGRELTSAGIYPTVCQVFDINRFYNLAGEYLECRTCKKKFISWSQPILKQLDIGHRVQFPVILTYRYACDMKVVMLMRHRGLGNSAMQILRKLEEQHGEEWYKRTVHYLGTCDEFYTASQRRVIAPPVFEEPIPMTPTPNYQWLLAVYCNDVLQRIDEVKAAITSTFGRVIKIDSTKKIMKKLAGNPFGTAAWSTNVGNEHGQVLMSVLTATEGHGLDSMVAGLVDRYSKAGVPPPELLYIDRGCCGAQSLRISAWPDIGVCLDIWHFMRRFASGCTTDAHPLYGFFLRRLSACIFKWSAEDLKVLMNAKRAQLVQAKIRNPSDDDVFREIGRKEMARHCRRTTRGVEKTRQLIGDLLAGLAGDAGRDTSGVPLFDLARIWEIWDSQKQHIACIQDPPGVRLYTKTGETVKGGITLPIYRCARGSSSLESFHLHLNRFIPSTQANDIHFQAYLMEGIARWNADRAAAALAKPAMPEPRTYSSFLRQAANEMSERVLGCKISERHVPPLKYTGELIGVEYLYDQTNQDLDDYAPDEEEGDAFDDDVDEGFPDEEDVEDPTQPPLVDPAMPASSSQSLASSTRDVKQPPETGRPVLGSPARAKKRALSPLPATPKRKATPQRKATTQQNRRPEETVSRPPMSPTRMDLSSSDEEYRPELDPVSDDTVSADDDSTDSKDEECVGPRNISGFSKKSKQKEKKNLERAVPVPVFRSTSPLPPLEVKPAVLPDPQVPAPFQFIIPSNTAGQANIRRITPQPIELSRLILRPPQPTMLVPVPQPRFILPTVMQQSSEQLYKLVPAGPSARAPGVDTQAPHTQAPKIEAPVIQAPVIQAPAQEQTFIRVPVEVPRSTKCFRKRMEREKQEGVGHRKYKPRTKISTCSKCKQPRTSLDHTQYYGSWYCARTSEQSLEEWREMMAARRKAKKEAKD